MLPRLSSSLMRYRGRIANPQDMFTFKRKITWVKDELKPLDEAYQDQQEATEKRAEEVVHRFKEVDPDKQLEVLSAKSMNEPTRRIVDYEDDDAAEFIIMFYERQAMTHLDADKDNIDKVLAGFYEKEKDTYNDMFKMLDSRIQKRGDPNPPRGSLITTTTTLA